MILPKLLAVPIDILAFELVKHSAIGLDLRRVVKLVSTFLVVLISEYHGAGWEYGPDVLKCHDAVSDKFVPDLDGILELWFDDAKEKV
jgi:hypothetical protein